MPIYEYGCQKCGHELSKMQKFSDAPLTECPRCGGELRKLISNPSFVLKGGGWYSDGYASADAKAPASSEKAPAAASCGASCSGGGCGSAAEKAQTTASQKDAAA